jgi:hypothetical protein
MLLIFQIYSLNLFQTAFIKISNHVFVRSRGPRGLDVGQQALAWWDWGFESRREHELRSLVSVVCCQVEVSAVGGSFIHRSRTECDRSMISKPQQWGGCGPLGSVRPCVYGVIMEVFTFLSLVCLTVMCYSVEWWDDNKLIGIWKERVVT